jgi:hypothetical protein
MEAIRKFSIRIKNCINSGKVTKMGIMKFGKLEINPAKNPAILDTVTWDPEEAWRIVQSLDETYWRSIQNALTSNRSLVESKNCQLYFQSYARYHDKNFFLAYLIKLSSSHRKNFRMNF